MNLDLLRKRLLAIRADADALLAELGPVEPPAAPEPPRFQTPAKYARERGYSGKTVARWLKLGLPKIGSGRQTRVRVAEADAWLAAGGPEAAARMAGAIAARGGR